MADFLGLVVVGIVLAVITMENRRKGKEKPKDNRNTATATRKAPASRGAARATAPHPATNPAPVATSTLPVWSEPIRAIQPQVAVTPHTDDIFAGSLHAETGEGYDPCHEDALPPQVEPCTLAPTAPPQAPASGLALSWTADTMVKAVVMQEILTKPQDRRRGR